MSSLLPVTKLAADDDVDKQILTSPLPSRYRAWRKSSAATAAFFNPGGEETRRLPCGYSHRYPRPSVAPLLLRSAQPPPLTTEAKSSRMRSAGSPKGLTGALICRSSTGLAPFGWRRIRPHSTLDDKGYALTLSAVLEITANHKLQEASSRVSTTRNFSR